MPLIGMNFLNAITLPTIGTYMNSTSQISGRATNRYSSQLTVTLLHCRRGRARLALAAVGRVRLVSVVGGRMALSRAGAGRRP